MAGDGGGGGGSMAADGGDGGDGGEAVPRSGGDGGSRMEASVIQLEEGWGVVLAGIGKLQNMIRSEGRLTFKAGEYMKCYGMVHFMCSQPEPYNYVEELYRRYKHVCTDYIQSTVTPALRGKHGELLLFQLVKEWENYKMMVRGLYRMFQYLDRLWGWHKPLMLTGSKRFLKLVLNDSKIAVSFNLMRMINESREGCCSDSTLIKNVISIFREIDSCDISYYKDNIESVFLKATADYYSKNFEKWNAECSYPSYMIKVEKSLAKEEQLACFFHYSTKPSLIKVFWNELLSCNLDHSGFKALLRKGKVDILSRIYNLFSRHEQFLLQFLNMFEEFLHKIKEDSMLLLSKAAAVTREVDNEGGKTKLDFTKKFIEPQYRCVLLVTKCFGNHSLFEKALKKSIVSIYNEDAAHTIFPLFTSVFNDFLKQGGIEKEKVLFKVFTLLSSQKISNSVSELCIEHIKEDALERSQSLLQLASNSHSWKENKETLQMEFVGKLLDLLPSYIPATMFDNFSELRVPYTNLRVGDCSMNELLVEFCDSLLRDSAKKKQKDTALEITLDKVVFFFIKDNDSSLENLWRNLGRRLFKPSNLKHEKLMLTKFEGKLGKYRRRTMGMIEDVTTMKMEHAVNFKKYMSMKQDDTPTIDFSVKVLTRGFWPAYRIVDLILPPQIARCVDEFKNYYASTFPGRKLLFMPRVGSCVVSANFSTKSVDLCLRPYQAVVLLLFSEVDKLSYLEIVALSNVPPDVAALVLLSLCYQGYEILKKTPDNKIISEYDVFEFNTAFTVAENMIKVPRPSDDVVPPIEDPKYVLEATIVRLMKTRQNMGKEELIRECQIRVMHCKRKKVLAIIDDLILRDYLELNEDVPDSYKYKP